MAKLFDLVDVAYFPTHKKRNRDGKLVARKRISRYGDFRNHEGSFSRDMPRMLRKKRTEENRWHEKK